MSDTAVTGRPQLFIDGSWRDAHAGSVAILHSATEQVLAYAALADQSDIDVYPPAPDATVRKPAVENNAPRHTLIPRPSAEHALPS
jgi:hypothetical protein